MRKMLRVWPLTWLFIALLLVYFSYQGGDTAILGGWALLIWTFPFGEVWWLFIFSHIPDSYATMPLEIVGDILCILINFWFWFGFVPWAYRTIKKKWGSGGTISN